MTGNGLPESEPPPKSSSPESPADPDAEGGVKPAEPGGAGVLDLGRFEAALQVDLKLGEMEPLESLAPDEPVGKVENFLNEIAEDMLQVLKSLKELENRQQELGARIEQMSQANARELDTLRRDLLGERKALAAISVFQAMVPWLDSLRIMHRKLHPKRDAGPRRQLQGIMDVLTMMLQGLGFEEFQVKLKEAFDPKRMECCGYAEGLPGVVLALERPGYRTQAQVVRPAGVFIANPEKPGPKKPKRGGL